VRLPSQRSRLARRAKAKEPAMSEYGEEAFRHTVIGGREVTLWVLAA